MGLNYMKCAKSGCENAREVEQSYCTEHRSELVALERQLGRYRQTGENKNLLVAAAILNDLVLSVRAASVQAAPAPTAEAGTLTDKEVEQMLDAAIGAVIDPVPSCVPPGIVRMIQVGKLTELINKRCFGERAYAAGKASQSYSEIMPCGHEKRFQMVYVDHSDCMACVYAQCKASEPDMADYWHKVAGERSAEIDRLQEAIHPIMESKGTCERCKKPVLVRVNEGWHTKSDKVWHEVCSYQEQIEKLSAQLRQPASKPVSPPNWWDSNSGDDEI